jgi:hypothetical protein
VVVPPLIFYRVTLAAIVSVFAAAIGIIVASLVGPLRRPGAPYSMGLAQDSHRRVDRHRRKERIGQDDIDRLMQGLCPVQEGSSVSTA